jgi:DNA-binding transcriptional MerR regulator
VPVVRFPGRSRLAAPRRGAPRRAWRVWDLGRRGLGGHGRANLRADEARGLLEPQRTEDGTRRYSANDLDLLRSIGDLLDAGLNLAGVTMVMDLKTRPANFARKSRNGNGFPPRRPSPQAPSSDTKRSGDEWSADRLHRRSGRGVLD